MTTDKNALDERIIQEMLKAYADGRIWSTCGFGTDDVRGMQNVLALLVQKGYTRPQPSGDAVKALVDLDALFLTILKPEPIKYVVPIDLTHDAINKLCKHWPTIRAALTQPKAVERDWTSDNVSALLKQAQETVRPQVLKEREAETGVIDLAAQGYIGVPEGYVLVPIEPTEEMWEAGYSAGDGETCTREIYKAMLKAAPNRGESP